ncbi:hypothetical protein VOLCADRAFT_119235 [Volvox carteri f. nagariensis]|uniref:Uncharacterized protein n=1 Tax=Volvox carteri f. nagariensis TaxID=3068 RepID=D8UB94_VOLCA|nr:uncharacterized protein VOLCADRAFT_119235 [Volvox carteri f. nagariensis]EFJ42964.1 hypothetical protein VOLCADRAFT_119235 [Volvox carteri f. nagariensis]|eukprot:XP_002956004.1 hypothetical protein VOLCADRAFT_119235 [Volvox carteri f. nagariensis]
MEGKTERREKLECPLVPALEQKLANMTRSRPVIGRAPRSAVLDKLASFLPQMAHENARLQQDMQDLACGLLELRDVAALRAAERAMEGQGGVLHSGGSGSSSSSSADDIDEDDSDDDDDEDFHLGDGDGELPKANTQGLEPMVVEEDEEEEEGVAEGEGAGGRGGVVGPRDGQAGLRRAGQGRSSANGRRRVAAKRSKLIEELS